MDQLAYWIYAVLQAVIVVVYFNIKENVQRHVALIFFTVAAPITTAMIAYFAIGKLFDWLQTSKETK